MNGEKHDVPISFRCTSTLVERIDASAKKLGIDRSSLIKLAMNIWLDQFDEQEGKIMPDLVAIPDSTLRAAESPAPYGSKDQK